MGNQESSLHSAAAHNDLGKVEAMITYQHANVNKRDKDGWTPLHFAAYGGALEVTQALLLRGAEAEPKDTADRTPLHLAALQGHATLTSLLLGRGAFVDAKDENLMTPLHKAAIKGHTEVGEMLLRLGADVHAAVKDGTRALHLAAWKGHLDFVKLLASRGADVRAVTHNGRTALHEAAESGYQDIVKFLLSAGANPYAQDQEGQVPATLANQSGHKDIAELIGGGRGAPSQGSGPAPSAPPYPTSTTGGGNVHYPEIHQGGSGGRPPAGAAEEQRNKDFWNQNLGEKDKEKAQNQGFWGSALGGDSGPAKPSAPKNEAAEEYVRNKEFWNEKLSGGIPALQRQAKDWDARVGRASDAWDSQIQQDQHAAGVTRPQSVNQGTHPRKQFEQNIVKQAQGLWNTLQGKGGEDHGDEKRRQEVERKRREAQEIDAEWGGGGGARRPAEGEWGAKPPTQELYDLKPYEDDDDYEEEKPAPKASQRGGEDYGLARRKLAQLELDLDREQGWVRGGSKAEADAVKARQKRIQDQEFEIAALRRQLASARY